MVRLARDMANVWIRTAGRKRGPNGLRLGQQTPFEGKDGSKHDYKAAHTCLSGLPRRKGTSNPTSARLGAVRPRFG